MSLYFFQPDAEDPHEKLNPMVERLTIIIVFGVINAVIAAIVFYFLVWLKRHKSSQADAKVAEQDQAAKMLE